MCSCSTIIFLAGNVSTTNICTLHRPSMSTYNCKSHYFYLFRFKVILFLRFSFIEINLKSHHNVGGVTITHLFFEMKVLENALQQTIFLHHFFLYYDNAFKKSGNTNVWLLYFNDKNKINQF